MAHADYFAYLQSRSRIGLLYRRWWLYPRLARQLNGRVLDVGCGLGDMLDYRPNTVGADINPLVVDWNCQRGLEVHHIKDGHLPFPNQSFDGAILDNVLEHVANPQPLLAEVARVLNPNARVVVGVPGIKGYSCDADHKVFLDQPALTNCMHSAGFRPVKFFHMPIGIPTLGRWLSQHCLYGVFDRQGIAAR